MACGLASAAMTLTNTVHPPAGATALLAAVDPVVSHLGWYLLPMVLLSTVLTLASACLINNIQRRFPLYWVTPVDLSKGVTDIERTPSVSRRSYSIRRKSEDEGGTLGEGNGTENRIAITSEHILVPEHIFLAAEEKAILEILRDRLKEGAPSDEGPELTSSISKESDKSNFSKSTF